MKNILFNFLIDKEAAFWYWAQSLIEWSWYFERKEFDFYKSELGGLTVQEEEVLLRLKNKLQEEDKGYEWLWQRYAGNPCDDLSLCTDIKKVLGSKFDIFWAKQVLLFENWQKLLSCYKFQDLNHLFLRAGYFLGVENFSIKSIDVKLLSYWNPDFPAGHSYRGINDFLLLNVSQLEDKNILRAVGVVVHEFTHIIENNSRVFEKLMLDSYKRIINPLNIRRDGPSWRHLLTETVLLSISGKRQENYLFLDIFGSEENSFWRDDYDLAGSDRNNYMLQIRLASLSILPRTREYIKSGKIIDSDFCDEAANIWIDIERRRGNLG